VIVEAHPPPPDVDDADDDGAAAAMQMDFPRPSRSGDDDDDGRAAAYLSAVAAPAPVRFVAHRALLGARSRLLRSMMAWQQQKPETAADNGSGSNAHGDGDGPGAAVLSLHDAPAAAFASLLAYLYGDALQVHIQATI